MDHVDSVESIAEEMKEVLWERVEPPVWWPAAEDYIIADSALGTLRAHMVRGHVEPGRVVANAHVIGQADCPNARYSDKLSHLSVTCAPAAKKVSHQGPCVPWLGAGGDIGACIYCGQKPC